MAIGQTRVMMSGMPSRPALPDVVAIDTAVLQRLLAFVVVLLRRWCEFEGLWNEVPRIRAAVVLPRSGEIERGLGTRLRKIGRGERAQLGWWSWGCRPGPLRLSSRRDKESQHTRGNCQHAIRFPDHDASETTFLRQRSITVPQAQRLRGLAVTSNAKRNAGMWFPG